MTEKIIKGVVERFSKIEMGTKNDEAKTPYAYVDVHLLDNKYPNKFFFSSAEEAKEKLMDRIPIGSTVEFKIFKKEESKYWNVDMKSFKLVYEGDGTVPKSQKVSDVNTSLLSVRKDALKHADEWIKLELVQSAADKKNTSNVARDDLEKEYFRFAETCEAWVMRE